MNSPATTTADLARLSWRLGEVYTEAVAETLARTGLHPDLIALHGQTLFHETTPTDFLNAPTRSTWQAGEPALLAERFRLPVISRLPHGRPRRQEARALR